MATTKKVTEATEETTEKTVDMEELVEFRAPIDRENKSDIFVSMNGRNLQIQRGKTVQIPRWAKEILDHSQEMDVLAYERTQAMKEQ